mmetsp:Transcript_16849/g.43808  ORF Transcript_16849/g.43808 Transcript_16849/m.43808 type:complete len:318 (+) Transcript_16849:709-1662(+)
MPPMPGISFVAAAAIPAAIPEAAAAVVCFFVGSFQVTLDADSNFSKLFKSLDSLHPRFFRTSVMGRRTNSISSSAAMSNTVWPRTFLRSRSIFGCLRSSKKMSSLPRARTHAASISGVMSFPPMPALFCTFTSTAGSAISMRTISVLPHSTAYQRAVYPRASLRFSSSPVTPLYAPGEYGGCGKWAQPLSSPSATLMITSLAILGIIRLVLCAFPLSSPAAAILESRCSFLARSISEPFSFFSVFFFLGGTQSGFSTRRSRGVNFWFMRTITDCSSPFLAAARSGVTPALSATRGSPPRDSRAESAAVRLATQPYAA